MEKASAAIPAGSAISLTYLHHETLDDRVIAARAARRLGFVPVPHIAARRLRSAAELSTQLARFSAEAAVDRVFVIAGDVDSVDGPYKDSLSVIRSGCLEANGVRSVGIGGHPQRHPKVPQAELWQALRDKVQALQERGLGCEIVTQFGFEADPVLVWLARLRQDGIAVPVRIGLPGPASVAALLRFAARCGVGTSAKMLSKYGGTMGRLIGSAGPERLADALLEKLSSDVHGEIRIHLYPFGGLARAAEWAEAFRGAARSQKVS